MQKRVMAINDISCYGRCALTVSMPILSAAGLETSIIPTVVLSTHLGYPNPSYISMTEHMAPITKHLESLNIKFDGITSGFLDSKEQIIQVAEFFRIFGDQNTFIMVDPTMADHGKMYGNKNFNNEFIQELRNLCSMAHIVVPNITEAAFLTNNNFEQASHSKPYIEKLLKGLLALGAKEAVVTGVVFDDNNIGCACMNAGEEAHYTFAKRFEGRYIGTGDIFASVVLAARMNGFDLEKSTEIATIFISKAIEKTNTVNTENSMAINFEQCMGLLIEMLGLYSDSKLKQSM